MGKLVKKKFIMLLMYVSTHTLTSYWSSFTFLLKQLLFYRLLLGPPPHVSYNQWLVLMYPQRVVDGGALGSCCWFLSWRTGWKCKSGDGWKETIITWHSGTWTWSLDKEWTTGCFSVFQISQRNWWWLFSVWWGCNRLLWKRSFLLLLVIQLHGSFIQMLAMLQLEPNINKTNMNWELIIIWIVVK